jgi:hypothetical protein
VPGRCIFFSPSSIPQEAVFPESETFEAAIFPPQKCVATERCNIAVSIKSVSDMEKTFFITCITDIFYNCFAKKRILFLENINIFCRIIPTSDLLLHFSIFELPV